MPHSLWKGSINFGLVHIPVSVHSAEVSKELSFRLLDSRDHSPIRYLRVNEKTGKEVDWDDIVKGYEHEAGSFVIMTEDDFKQAAVEANQSIEIDDFVDKGAVPLTYFEKPYFLLPDKGGQKGYVLLRETLRKLDKLAVARVVLRNKEHLAVLYPHEHALVLNALRYEHEVKPLSEFNFPPLAVSESGVTAKELQMAERLVKEMMQKWDPSKYQDRYVEKLTQIIEEKASGQPHKKAKGKAAGGKEKVIDMAELLRMSLEEREKGASKKKRKTA